MDQFRSATLDHGSGRDLFTEIQFWYGYFMNSISWIDRFLFMALGVLVALILFGHTLFYSTDVDDHSHEAYRTELVQGR